MNAALRPMSREAFIREVTRDVPETPRYYLHSRDLNKAGPPVRVERAMPPLLPPREFAAVARQGALILDTRPGEAFAASHPAGALNVSLDGQYASWVGTLVRPDERLLLVAETDRVEEAVMRLARVGYENVEGVLEGGMARWSAEGLPVASVERLQVEAWLDGGRSVLDVRRSREWSDSHIRGATHIPLAELPERLGELDRGTAWVAVCTSGYRSAIAVSILARAGFGRVANAIGGMDAWRTARLPLETAG